MGNGEFVRTQITVMYQETRGHGHSDADTADMTSMCLGLQILAK